MRSRARIETFKQVNKYKLLHFGKVFTSMTSTHSPLGVQQDGGAQSLYERDAIITTLFFANTAVVALRNRLLGF